MRIREWSVRGPVHEGYASMCEYVTETRLRSIITVADMVRLAFQQRCLQIADDSSQSASSTSLSLSIIYDDCRWKYCQKMGSLWARDPCLGEQLWFVTSRNRRKSLRKQIRVSGSLLVSRSSGCILSGKRKVSWPQFDRNRPRLAVTTHWCTKLLPIGFGCRIVLFDRCFFCLFVLITESM